MTSLPIIPKGILTVEDARIAVSMGAPAIILSNHGARHLDGVPSPLQVALAIHDEAPEIFSQTEVLADGGVRYGTDALKLLALGCKAVGLGRSFMYANIYGQKGVERAIELLKTEIALDAINLGVTNLTQLNSSWVSRTIRCCVKTFADHALTVGSKLPAEPPMGPLVAVEVPPLSSEMIVLRRSSEMVVPVINIRCIQLLLYSAYRRSCTSPAGPANQKDCTVNGERVR